MRVASLLASGAWNDLNYAEHAGDLGERRPNEPATFMKPASTIVAPADEVVLPLHSGRTTGEAELGLVIGRMTSGPAALVAFVSQVMTLEPGDVISTGTPGAVVLRHGATIGCEIPGVGAIACPVRDRKAGCGEVRPTVIRP